MKKSLFLLIGGCFILALCQGCGLSAHNKGFETTHGYMNQKGVSFLGIGESALEIAEAEKRLAEAEISKAIAYNIKNNASGTGRISQGNFTGVIVNDNASKTLYIRHPFYDQTIRVSPGSSTTLMTPEVPKYVMARFSNRQNFSRYRIYEKSTHYNSMRIDYGARLY